MATDGNQEARVAPESLNTLNLGPRLRICAMKFLGPPALQTEVRVSGKSALVSDLMQTFTLDILKKGYVIIIPFNPGAAILGRTTETGEVVRITPAEMDAGDPPAPEGEHLFPFPPGAKMALFWTRRRSIWKSVWEAVKADRVKAMEDHPFSRFRVKPRDVPSRNPAARETWEALDRFRVELYTAAPGKTLPLQLLLANTQGMFGDVCVHGYYSGAEIRSLGLGRGNDNSLNKDLDEKAQYLIGRSDAIAAYHLAEALSRHNVDLAIERMDRWTTFGICRSFIDVTERALSVPELDDMMGRRHGGIYEVNDANKERTWPWRYWTYAHACAEAGVKREVFWDAINVRVNDPSWARYAQQIWKDHGLPHPAKPPAIALTRSPEAVQRYFDLYRFGFQQAERQKENAWIKRTIEGEEALRKESDRLRAPVARLLQARVSTIRLLQELEAHGADGDVPTAENRDAAARIFENHIALALTIGHPWYETFRVEKEKPWIERLKPYAETAATVFDKSGELISKALAAAINSFNESLLERRAELENALRALNGLVKRYTDLKMSMRLVDRQIGVGTRIRIIANAPEFFAISKIEVFTPFGTSASGPVGVFKKTQITQRLLSEKPGDSGVFERVRLTRVKEVVIERTFTLDATPFKELRAWPDWMAHLGDAISLALMIHDEVTGQGKKGLDFALQVSQNGLQFIGSLSAAMRASLIIGDGPLFKWATRLGAVGQLAEWAISWKEAYELRYSEKGLQEMRELAEQGDELVVDLQYLKTGISVTAPMAGFAVGGAAAWATAGSKATTMIVVEGAWSGFCVGLGAAALAGLIIQGVVSARKAPPDWTVDYEKKLTEYLAFEFGKDHTKTSTSLEILRDYASKTERVLGIVAG